VRFDRRLALIEIGTNTTKLLVADTSPRGYRVRRVERRTTRIGRGIGGGGRIGTREIAASVTALESLGRTVRAERCDGVFAFSTFALRRASNAKTVARRLEKTIGEPIHSLTGRDEARFAYLAARSKLPLARPVTVLADIGGGSTELVVARRRRIVVERSIPLGALHLTERFIHSDPVDPAEFDALLRHVARVVARTLRSAGVDRTSPRDIDLAASGGAIGALSWVIASRGGARAAEKRLPPRIRLGDAAGFLDYCLSLPLDKRRKIRGLHPDRADIVCAGLAIAIRIMRGLRKRALFTSRGGLREGVLLHLIQNGYRW
jgi:exopolyphosphatase/guanosine-5'-triphosphate,3'-diphosphate pyrophosphatase